MGLGSYSFSTLTTIRGIAFRALEKFPKAQIADTGIKVVRLLETFKTKHPDKIPTKPGGGLLDMGPLPINDFELAQHLIATNDPAMAKLIKGAKGLPVLIAYLATLTNGAELPSEYLLESALPYAVASLTVESEVSKLWNKDLQTEIERLLPLANKGAKFKGKKLGALGPLAKAVRQRLKRWPDESAKSIWNALSDSPPKGLTFCDNRAGKYVEYDKRTFKGSLKNTNYRRFANIVSEQHTKLKSLTV
jgi:hypothetical protein